MLTLLAPLWITNYCLTAYKWTKNMFVLPEIKFKAKLILYVLFRSSLIFWVLCFWTFFRIDFWQYTKAGHTLSFCLQVEQNKYLTDSSIPLCSMDWQIPQWDVVFWQSPPVAVRIPRQWLYLNGYSRCLADHFPPGWFNFLINHFPTRLARLH